MEFWPANAVAVLTIFSLKEI